MKGSTVQIDSIPTGNLVKVSLSRDYFNTQVEGKVRLDFKLNKKYIVIKNSVNPAPNTFFNVLKPKHKLYLEDERIDTIRDLGTVKSRAYAKLSLKYN